MKKQIIVLLVMMSGFISFANAGNINSLTTDSLNEKFLGTWDMIWKDLPDGDVECQLVLTNVDGKLHGELTSEGIVNKYGQSLKLYDVEIDGKELSFMYTAEGYDISIAVEMTDENELEGYMMDMFEVFATKSTESK